MQGEEQGEPTPSPENGGSVARDGCMMSGLQRLVRQRHTMLLRGWNLKILMMWLMIVEAEKVVLRSGALELTI